MLVPSDMLGAQTKLMNQIEKFQANQVREGGFKHATKSNDN